MKRFIFAFLGFLTAFFESFAVMPAVKSDAPKMAMAKVKFSALISDMRNKLNGSVFSKNRAGSYLRNKVTPTNPQTASQAGVRSILGGLASGWRSLSQGERDAFINAVGSWTSTDIFGDTVTPSGFQLYVRLNSNLVNAGQSAITAPPLPVGISGATSLSIVNTIGGTSLTLTVDPDPVPAGEIAIIEATAGYSPGINNFSGKFRKIGTVAAAASIGNVWADYIAKFGTPTAGLKSAVRVKFVNITTGEASPYLSENTIWLA